jgi:hypothetical protein
LGSISGYLYTLPGGEINREKLAIIQPEATAPSHNLAEQFFHSKNRRKDTAQYYCGNTKLKKVIGDFWPSRWDFGSFCRVA